ncbi:MAG: molecular chaperone DnaK, partial [Rhodospirillaceae bacterium]|nr:molecular chaperone DnaK [Rhodospirillaceae bacterium]
QKMLEELGEKAEPEERARIETAVSELKDAVTGDSKDVIEAKIKTLSEASAGLAQKLYAEHGAQDETGGAKPAEGGDDDHVVDAEFEEVKGDDEQKRA